MSDMPAGLVERIVAAVHAWLDENDEAAHQPEG